MITILLLLLAQDRVVYTNVGRQIHAEVRPAPKPPPSPELLAKLKAREWVPSWPGGPTVASTAWRPWMDRPGAIYDRWRDPELRAWRAAGPRVVYVPPTPVIRKRR